MNKLFFDIETVPADEGSLEKLRYLYDRKREKHQKRAGEEGEEYISFDEFFEKTATDGSFGRAVCIGYARNDEPVQALSGDEREMIGVFWDLAANTDIFVGHNIRDFDLPFILQRSTVLGVKPTWTLYEEPGVSKYKMTKFLDFARYKSSPIFDTMWEWNRWKDKWDNKTIEHVALSLGIPTPKEGIDGSQVWDFFKKGKLKDIVEYCKRDVDTTRAVYKRMIFESLPDRETLPF